MSLIVLPCSQVEVIVPLVLPHSRTEMEPPEMEPLLVLPYLQTEMIEPDPRVGYLILLVLLLLPLILRLLL